VPFCVGGDRPTSHDLGCAPASCERYGYPDRAQRRDLSGSTFEFILGRRRSSWLRGRSELVIEYRWAGNQTDRLPALAADLVQLRVAVIVAGDPPRVGRHPPHVGARQLEHRAGIPGPRAPGADGAENRRDGARLASAGDAAAQRVRRPRGHTGGLPGLSFALSVKLFA